MISNQAYNSHLDLEANQLCFRLSGQIFSVPLRLVHDILKLKHFRSTRLPLAPSHVMGLINIRSQIVAILNLEWMLYQTSEESKAIGLLIDVKGESYCLAVEKVLGICAHQSLPRQSMNIIPPTWGDFVDGIVNDDEGTVIQLSMENLVEHFLDD